MKTSLGVITIHYYNFNRGLRVYLCRELLQHFGQDIVFNIKDMIITRPTIDSRVTFSIKSGQFSYLPKGVAPEDYVGKYNVIQKDEDTFKLKKIKNGSIGLGTSIKNA